MILIACGNCVLNALWHQFPAIVSWSAIFSVWLIGLSCIRTATQIRVAGVPPAYLATPLVLLVWLFAPAVLGPLLGLWIPICCVVGTCDVLSRRDRSVLRRSITSLTVVAIVCLVTFGTWDYIRYCQYTPEERARWTTAWDRAEVSRRQRDAVRPQRNEVDAKAKPAER